MHVCVGMLVQILLLTQVGDRHRHPDYLVAEPACWPASFQSGQRRELELRGDWEGRGLVQLLEAFQLHHQQHLEVNHLIELEEAEVRLDQVATALPQLLHWPFQPLESRLRAAQGCQKLLQPCA